MSTPNRMQLHWEAVKPFIKREWPRISETAIENMDGNFDRFLEYLKESYNHFPLEEARARNKIQDFINKLEE